LEFKEWLIMAIGGVIMLYLVATGGETIWLYLIATVTIVTEYGYNEYKCSRKQKRRRR
jgi:hypothetical protein